MAAGECPTYPETPCRVNLDLMPKGDSFLDPSGTAFWMYALTAVAMAIFLYGVWAALAIGAIVVTALAFRGQS